jgi:hypothetical protein
VKSTLGATVAAALLLLGVLAGNGASRAEESEEPDGQALWRSCSSCHCVPDLRIPEDEDWLKLNETTTCISGSDDTPESRAALDAYLRAEETIRPLLVDERHPAPVETKRGRLRLPATAGSAYLKADRASVRTGSPPKIRVRWSAGEKEKALELPVGDYRVISYSFYRTDEKGRRWIASGSSAEGCLELTIRSEEEDSFDLQPEIQAHLSSEADEIGHVLGFFMTNRYDQRMSLARAGKLVIPSWIISDAKGKRIDSGDFEVT